METLRTAIQLRQALDDAPKKLDSIGSCAGMRAAWELDVYGETYDDHPIEWRTFFIYS